MHKIQTGSICPECTQSAWQGQNIPVMSSPEVRIKVSDTVVGCPFLHRLPNVFFLPGLPTATSTCWLWLSTCPSLGLGGSLLSLRFCLGREADGPFLTLSRHLGDYCCGSGRGSHQRALFWAVPGHEQERTAVCFGEFHH